MGKEKSCVRSLERFDRILQDWLSKDPSHGTRTPGEKKRTHDDEDTSEDKDNSQDNDHDVSPTPTRKRRVLFSQSMVTNELLNIQDDADAALSSEARERFPARSCWQPPEHPEPVPSRELRGLT